jgi:hypothetical protein
MRKTFTLVLVLALVLMAVGVANASTSADKQAAIDAGLAYLASHQNVDGSWSYGSAYGNYAATGAALLAFTDQYYKPLGWNTDYSSVVSKATNYLLSVVQPITLTPNWWNFPSSTQTGLIWGGNGGLGDYTESTYTTGIVATGLSRLVSNPYGGSPLVAPGTLISGGAADGLTYSQAIQKIVNTMAWGQTGPAGGNKDGGWRYIPGSGDSDMSTTQWGPITFLFASNVSGVTIPNDGSNPIQTHLRNWLAADQYPVPYPTVPAYAGGVDYQPGQNYIVNNTHAGAFLLSNHFAGGGGSAANALAWLNAHWKDAVSGTWYGNEGHPYAMWAVYKALETIYGVTGTGPITNLNLETTPIDPGADWNWWEDYCQYLCLSQLGDGSWPGYSYWNSYLEAAWYINILNATSTGPPVPLPGTLGLLSTGLFGLLGAGWWRRRKS